METLSLFLSSPLAVTSTTSIEESREIMAHTSGIYNVQGSVSRKTRKLFGPEKPFVKLRPAYSVKLVFSYVVKGIKIKITAKFRAPRSLCFEDTKRIMSPEMRPKSFGTFEKRVPGFREPQLVTP